MGLDYQEVIDDPNYTSIFSFTIELAIDPSVPDGEIISQDPEADRSMMIVPEKIAVTLTVSTGVIETEVIDVTNVQYQEATISCRTPGSAWSRSMSRATRSPRTMSYAPSRRRER